MNSVTGANQQPSFFEQIAAAGTGLLGAYFSAKEDKAEIELLKSQANINNATASAISSTPGKNSDSSLAPWVIPAAIGAGVLVLVVLVLILKRR
jgi:hypothetical protein